MKHLTEHIFYNMLNLYQNMREFGVEHFFIELLERYKCKNKNELNIRKEKWINKLKPSLNFYGCYLCESTFSGSSQLKGHLSYIHNINVTYYECDQKDCKYK